MMPQKTEDQTGKTCPSDTESRIILSASSFDWQRFVSDKMGPKEPTMRHVLLALSLYMSSKGDSCFPSVRTLASDTGLCRQTVMKHLSKAEEQGWIHRFVKKNPGQGWAHHQYRATIPEALKNVVNQIDHVEETRSTSLTKVVKQVDLTISLPIHKYIHTSREKQIELIIEFAKASGLKNLAESFVDYYTSNGWKIGGRAPMKCWQSAYRNWCRTERRQPPSNGRQQTSKKMPSISQHKKGVYDECRF